MNSRGGSTGSRTCPALFARRLVVVLPGYLRAAVMGIVCLLALLMVLAAI
jgi:hypothetical protein